MDLATAARERALSHQAYLDTLLQPTITQSRRISEVQVRKEREIDAKYHTEEEHAAATTIQRAYRGHRDRRQLDGLTLDPSSRWLEIIKEMRYRSAIAPHNSSRLDAVQGRSRAPSDLAKLNWRRAGQIAEHAVAGESTPSLDKIESSPKSTRKTRSDTGSSLLMDLRYFLEMVDQKHRYGANLQVFHEEWLRDATEQNFFNWLDRGDGRWLDLPGCTRERLDKERIRYLSKEERLDYLVRVDAEGRLCWDKTGERITTSVDDYQDSMHGIVPKGSTDPTFGDEDVQRQLSVDARVGSGAAEWNDFAQTLSPQSTMDQYISSSDSDSTSTEGADRRPSSMKESSGKHRKHRFRVSPATILNHLLRASVRPGTWIYVSDTVGRLFVGIKSSGAFQHASFLSGARISSAGAISIEDGKLTYLSPLSGHYRPTTRSFRRFVDDLKQQNVDLSSLRVSKAYEILLGMEYYGKTKKGVKKVVHHSDHENGGTSKSNKDSNERRRFDIHALDDMTATELIGRRWKKEHEHRTILRRLMDDLHIHRASDSEDKT